MGNHVQMEIWTNSEQDAKLAYDMFHSIWNLLSEKNIISCGNMSNDPSTIK